MELLNLSASICSVSIIIPHKILTLVTSKLSSIFVHKYHGKTREMTMIRIPDLKNCNLLKFETYPLCFTEQLLLSQGLKGHIK